MKRIKKETTIANLHHKSRCTASLIAAGMPAKMTMENQIPGVRLAILTSLQTIDAEESQEVRESHYRCGGNGH